MLMQACATELLHQASVRTVNVHVLTTLDYVMYLDQQSACTKKL